MNYKCNHCGNEFHEHDQTDFDHKHGICPYCGMDALTFQSIHRWRELLRRVAHLSALFKPNRY